MHPVIEEFQLTVDERIMAGFGAHILYLRKQFLLESTSHQSLENIFGEAEELAKRYDKPFGDLMLHLEEFSQEELEYLMDHLPMLWHRSRVQEILDKKFPDLEQEAEEAAEGHD